MAAPKKLKAKANVQIKYAGEYIKAGQEFEVQEKDVEELNQYAEITIPKEKKDKNPKNDKSGEEEKEGQEEGDK